MIVLFNPLSTTPGKQPLPLSLLSLAAVLERAGIAWALVDGNIDGRSRRGDHRHGSRLTPRRAGRRRRCSRSPSCPARS